MTANAGLMGDAVTLVRLAEHDPDTIARLWTHAIGELARRLLPRRRLRANPAWSNASTQSGTSNDPATATGPNPASRPIKPSHSIERYYV